MARLHPEPEKGMPYLEPRETQRKGRWKSCSLNAPCSQHHKRCQSSALHVFHLTWMQPSQLIPTPPLLPLREPAWSSPHNININREDFCSGVWRFWYQNHVRLLVICSEIMHAHHAFRTEWYHFCPDLIAWIFLTQITKVNLISLPPRTMILPGSPLCCSACFGCRYTSRRIVTLGLGFSGANSPSTPTLVALRENNRRDPRRWNLSLEHIKNPIIIQPCGVDKTKSVDISTHIDLRNYSYLKL